MCSVFALSKYSVNILELLRCFYKEVSYAQQGSIYLIKTSVEAVIL